MARKMVLVPYEMARHILEPMQGDATFDLKEGADVETRDRLNRALNQQDGDKEEEDKQPKKLLMDEDAGTRTDPTPTLTPTPTVRRRPRQPKQTPTHLSKSQLRTKLQKTGAFDTRDKTVKGWDGKTVADSNIDSVLDHIYSARSRAHPAGTKEIAARLKLMNMSQFPNKTVCHMIAGHVSPQDTPRTSRRWKKF